jgi:hypothetical protein
LLPLCSGGVSIAPLCPEFCGCDGDGLNGFCPPACHVQR